MKKYRVLSLKHIKTVERLKIKNIILIGIVGEGILNRYGIAAKVFIITSEKDININIISAGTSRVHVILL